MKKYFLFLTIALFLLSACNKDEGFVNELEDDTSWQDDWDDSGDGASDNQSGEEGSLTLYAVDQNIISKIKDYNTSAALQPFQDDIAKHFEMWDFVTRLIPLDQRGKIAEFEVFHGDGQLLGYVTPLNQNDLSQWRFALAIDAATGDLSEIDFAELFTYVTIHEYGHVLTLNDSQVDVNGTGCDTYFTGEGCSRPNSYINRLYDLGWKDIADDPLLDEPLELYDKYSSRFVSEYAATNPGEDIAEVFSFFVTLPTAPSGNKISDQKINLLYQFPELVELRNEIRANGPALNLRAGSWTENPIYDKFKVCRRQGCRH